MKIFNQILKIGGYNNLHYFDPLQINSFVKLVDSFNKKAIPKIREIAFYNMLKNEKYDREGDVFLMKGANYSDIEKQSAIKLTKAGFYVVFPGKGQIKKIKVLENSTDKRKNDVYIYDKKTYNQSKVDLKTINSGSIKILAEHIISGSGQAPVIVLDIQGGTNRWNLIKGIRRGWTDDTKRILLNWRGQWYQLKKEQVYSDYLEKTIK